MNIKLKAIVRDKFGKGTSRGFRRDGQVPAVLYGAGQPNTALSLVHKDLVKMMEKEEFFSQLITLNIEDKEEQVVFKALQRHAYKPQIMHIDFLRVKATEKISMRIPLHFIGETIAPGVKQGGLVSKLLSEVEIRCLPADLPKYIEVNIADMTLNSTLHLSDLPLPSGVEISNLARGNEYNKAVVSIHVAKMAEFAEGRPEAIPAAEVPATAIKAETATKE